MTERRALRDLIARSANAVVFTGAGVSTESGIPDFRSPGGIWSRTKPIMFEDFIADENIRRRAWERTFSGAAGWTGKKPNAGHFAVARLVQSGKVSAIITQNVDNLHQESGVPDDKVIELHGNASYAVCLDCGLRHEFAEFRPAFLEHGLLPSCRACAGIVKSATISFGQTMPERPMALARAAADACDLFIVLGSSLVVVPAAHFPIIAKRNGARLAIVNREPTDLDFLADLVLHDEIGPTLSEIVGVN
jgi:NAD-dependent deacetylase